VCVCVCVCVCRLAGTAATADDALAPGTYKVHMLLAVRYTLCIQYVSYREGLCVSLEGQAHGGPDVQSEGGE
jgi:hypothetical protein